MLDLVELAHDRLDGALHVPLEHDVEVGDAAGLQLLEQLVERDATAGRLLRQGLAPQPRAPLLGELARAVVLDDARHLTGLRWMIEAENLDRVARAGLLELLAAVVVQRTHPSPRVAGDDRVPDFERPALDEHRRNRAAADIE